MSEYEERYPDAYGRQEVTDRAPRRRHFLGLGLPRQVRDTAPAVAEERPDAPPIKVVDIAALEPSPPPAPQPHHAERPRRPLVERTPREICDEVAAQLTASPFIDATGISLTVDGSEVTLSGTINSLIAIALAKALASNVPGVSRVQVQLRVQQAPKRYELSGAPVRKVEAE